jgi:hypothetical protein
MLQLEILAVRNIQRIVQELSDIRLLNNPLTWINRISSVEAMDGEITARFLGRVVVADIINTDQGAVVRAAEPIRFQDHTIATIKHGEMITSTQMEVIMRIAANQGTGRDFDIFRNYIATRIAGLIDGVRQRRETLLMGMLLDSFNYNRLGVQITGSWGTPADCKITVTTPWDDIASTPVTDIKNAVRNHKNKYGVQLNRVSLPDAQWLNIVKTTEFQNMARLYSNINFPAGAFPVQDDTLTKALASRVFEGMIFETNDNQVWYENNDGSRTAARLHPIDKVILTSTQLDNNPGMWDWANGVVFETLRGAVPSMVGGFGGPQSGPVGYVTGANAQGNPPGWTMWAVQRGFPRKHYEATNVVLTVL